MGGVVGIFGIGVVIRMSIIIIRMRVGRRGGVVWLSEGGGVEGGACVCGEMLGQGKGTWVSGMGTFYH